MQRILVGWTNLRLILIGLRSKNTSGREGMQRLCYPDWQKGVRRFKVRYCSSLLMDGMECSDVWTFLLYFFSTLTANTACSTLMSRLVGELLATHSHFNGCWSCVIYLHYSYLHWTTSGQAERQVQYEILSRPWWMTRTSHESLAPIHSSWSYRYVHSTYVKPLH